MVPLRVFVRQFLVLGALLALGACQGAHLLNETKAALAKEANKKYKSVSVAEVVPAIERDLDALDRKARAAVFENHKLRFKIDLIRMADDQTVVLGDWVNKEIDNGLRKLGFVFVQGISPSPKVLKFLDGQIDIKSHLKRISMRVAIMSLSTAAKPPECREEMPETWDEVEKMPAGKAKGYLQTDYKIYKKHCQDYKKQLQTYPKSGVIGINFKAWRSATSDLELRKARIREYAKKVKDQREAYTKALKKQKSSGSKTIGAQAKEAAKKLADAIEGAQKAVGAIGLDALPKEHTRSILVLLQAVSSGKIDEAAVKKQPELRVAAEVAKSLPSLAGDMQALIKRGRAPSVSNLVIALQHQIILMEQAQERKRLAEQRVALYQRKFEHLASRARFLRAARLALCNFTLIQAGKIRQPGARLGCDLFVYGGSSPAKKCKFRTSGGTKFSIGAGCALNATWQQALTTSFQNRAQGELYDAFRYYASSAESGAAAAEIDFKLIDLDHRETLAATRAGIKAYDNLISVPLTQLSAYHASGITAAEVADLIVKAIGLSAIAAGLLK